MIIFIILFILININTYFVKSYSINKMNHMNPMNFKNEINKDQSIYKENMGKDDRNVDTENINNIKILENIYKKEIIDKLINKKTSEYEKLEIINTFCEFTENFNTQNINTLKIKMGGLEDDWNFEDF
jgi:hypothetical protein